MPKQYIITESQLSSIVNDAIKKNDIELITLLKQGDRKASNKFYEKYYPYFYKLIVSKTQKFSNDDINQIVSDALNRAMLKINLFDNKGSFEGWLKRILRNSLSDFLIKKEKDKSRIHFTSDVPDVEVSTDREDIGKTYMKLLYQFKENLPERQFDFLKLHLDGFTHDEIGKMMGTTGGTSKWHVSTALGQFKRWLADNNLI